MNERLWKEVRLAPTDLNDVIHEALTDIDAALGEIARVEKALNFRQSMWPNIIKRMQRYVEEKPEDWKKIYIKCCKEMELRM